MLFQVRFVRSRVAFKVLFLARVPVPTSGHSWASQLCESQSLSIAVNRCPSSYLHLASGWRSEFFTQEVWSAKIWSMVRDHSFLKDFTFAKS
jgi:hypothetical protein